MLYCISSHVKITFHGSYIFLPLAAFNIKNKKARKKERKKPQIFCRFSYTNGKPKKNQENDTSFSFPA